MTQNMVIKLSHKQSAPIVSRTFPDYVGRKVSIEFRESITFYNTNWGDGSKNYYAAVSANGKTGLFNAPAPWVNPVEGKTIEIDSNIMIVEHSIFCGHDCGIRIYANPCHLPKWLSSGENDKNLASWVKTP